MRPMELRLSGPQNDKTVFAEDGKEQALRITVEDPTAQDPAAVKLLCASGTSVSEYPVLALCLRLSRPALRYRFTLWRTTACEELSMGVMRDVRALNSWRDLVTEHIVYAPTDDWQLVTIDTSRARHPALRGCWTQLLLGLLDPQAGLRAGDAVLLKWAGLFPCTETAQRYFDAGIWFDRPTPAFWHAASLPMKKRPAYPVLPQVSAEKAAARIRNDRMLMYGKLPSDHLLVAPFDPGRTYCHHAGLAWFCGRLYATWSSGPADEDVPGQQVLLSWTEDFFHWHPPIVLGAPQKGSCADTCLQNGFLFATEDELFAVYREYDFAASMFREDGSFDPTRPWELAGCHDYYRSTRDGDTWGAQMPSPVSANEAPRRTASGRYIGGCGNAVIYSDAPNGHNWLLSKQTEEDLRAALGRGARMLTEASWYQTDDKIIHLMQRSNAGYIWHCESYDNGATWSGNYPTNFATDHTMPYFGRLPDGRFYFVGDPFCSNDSRYPLALCLSDDGRDFDTVYILRNEPYVMRTPGWAKGGYFAYPEVLIHGDYMYVLYSKHKEVMEITRVALKDIR